MSAMRNSVMLIGIPNQPLMLSEKTASFKLAVRDDKEPQKNYIFDCIGYGTIAKRIVSKVKKGLELAIEGSLRNFNYEDGMHTHTHTEIVVHDLFLIDKPEED